MELALPLTNTARKYGYILWLKERDEELRHLLGDHGEVALLLPNGTEKRSRIDWKHHRISVGYAVTRSLEAQAATITLKNLDNGRIGVAFS